MSERSELKHADNPQEMRAELHRQSLHHSTVKNCFTLAQMVGFNGEDTMTVLAYNLLALARRQEKQILDLVNTQAPQQLIINPKDLGDDFESK